MTYVHAKDIELGIEVIVSPSTPIVGKAIARDGAYLYVGLNSDVHDRRVRPNDVNWAGCVSLGMNFIPEAFHYPYYTYYLLMNESVKLLLVEEKIVAPDQFCAQCKLPAPHVLPNVNDMFICVSCKVIGEL